ncbi:MAG: GFA family protein [Hyphomicrobiales bacterium]|nr:GFA family protein [Hyphomicrobiales bacterium]
MTEARDSATEAEGTTERHGHCLCGGVRVTLKPGRNEVSACHCRMCRRWGGGPLIAIDGGADVVVHGTEIVTVYDSSPWAERAFCSVCGSNLFYRIKESGQHYVLAGLFDDEGGAEFDLQVFIDEKPDYYSFANKTKTLTGAEVFAMYAPKV